MKPQVLQNLETNADIFVSKNSGQVDSKQTENWQDFDVSYKTFKQATKKINIEKKLLQFKNKIQQYEQIIRGKNIVGIDKIKRIIISLKKIFEKIETHFTMVDAKKFDSEMTTKILENLNKIKELLYTNQGYLTNTSIKKLLKLYLTIYNNMSIASVTSREKLKTLKFFKFMNTVWKVRTLNSFIKQIEFDDLFVQKSYTKFKRAKTLLDNAEQHCKKTFIYINEYNSKKTSCRRTRELVSLIYKEQKLISLLYIEALSNLGKWAGAKT